MAAEVGGAIDPAREHRVSGLDRLHEQRIGKLGGRGTTNRPGDRGIAGRGVRERRGDVPARQDLVLGADHREGIGTRQAELAGERRRDERAVLLVGARDAG